MQIVSVTVPAKHQVTQIEIIDEINLQLKVEF